MIRVHVQTEDYGNELHLWVLDERPDGRWLARIEDGQLVFHQHNELGVQGPPTLRLHRNLPECIFAALEGYRDRNVTAEAVLQASVDDARDVRDRLLAIIERDA